MLTQDSTLQALKYLYTNFLDNKNHMLCEPKSVKFARLTQQNSEAPFN